MTSWFDAAACRGASPAMFHPERGDWRAETLARQVCASCPVTQQCLEHALTNQETLGMWGGTSARERRRIGYRGRAVPVCGTRAGYEAHRRRGEPTCEACRDANRVFVAERRSTHLVA